jgi:hypothetical protein
MYLHSFCFLRIISTTNGIWRDPFIQLYRHLKMKCNMCEAPACSPNLLPSSVVTNEWDLCLWVPAAAGSVTLTWSGVTVLLTGQNRNLSRGHPVHMPRGLSLEWTQVCSARNTLWHSLLIPFLANKINLCAFMTTGAKTDPWGFRGPQS